MSGLLRVRVLNWRCLKHTELGVAGFSIGRLVYELMTWGSACSRMHGIHVVEIAVMDTDSPNHDVWILCLELASSFLGGNQTTEQE